MATEVSPFKNIELEDKVKINLVFKKFMEDSSYRELIAKKFKYQLFEEFPVELDCDNTNVFDNYDLLMENGIYPKIIYKIGEIEIAELKNIYTCVEEISECPSIVCIAFKSAPFCNKCVANECLKTCGVISLSICA